MRCRRTISGSPCVSFLIMFSTALSVNLHNMHGFCLCFQAFLMFEFTATREWNHRIATNFRSSSRPSRPQRIVLHMFNYLHNDTRKRSAAAIGSRERKKVKSKNKLRKNKLRKFRIPICTVHSPLCKHDCSTLLLQIKCQNLLSRNGIDATKLA